MNALDFAPDNCRHPRHRGLRSFGRFAALEVTVIGGAFAGLVVFDRAREAVRRSLRLHRS